VRRPLRAIAVVVILAAAGWLQVNADAFEDLLHDAVRPEEAAPVELLPLQVEERWLVMVIEFPSRPSGAGRDSARAEAMLTGENAADEYLFEMSGGTTSLEVFVNPIVHTAAANPSIYGADRDGERDSGTGDDDPDGLVTEAVESNLASVNTSRFDLDGDGRLDRLLILHTGRAQENGGSSSDIWSHFSFLMDPVVVNGTEVAHYTMASFESGLGTILHEMVHQMGAIDLYDVHSEVSTSNWNGVGDWDIMASGNWNGNGRTPALPMAATLRLIGADRDFTLDQQTLSSGPYTFNLTPLSAGGMTVRIPLADGEWVWIEHRGDIGFDRDLPGNGVLVSQQDDGAGDLMSNEVNADPEMPWLRVIEADGDDGLVRAADEGTQSDTFDVGKMFGSDGVTIRDRSGRLVGWNATVVSLNDSVATITINPVENRTNATLPRSPIELMGEETIPITFHSVESCMPWIDLVSSDGRSVQLIGARELSSDEETFNLEWLDPVEAPESGTLRGSIGCGNQSSVDIDASWHIVPHRLITETWVGEIHWQKQSEVTIPLAFEGNGSRRYQVVVEGPLERIATTTLDQRLGESSNITLIIDPSSLLSPGMLAEGEVVLVDEVGIERRISMTTTAVDDEPDDAFSWFREPANTITVLLVLLALTIGSSSDGRRRGQTEPDIPSMRRVGHLSSAHEAMSMVQAGWMPPRHEVPGEVFDAVESNDLLLDHHNEESMERVTEQGVDSPVSSTEFALGGNSVMTPEDGGENLNLDDFDPYATS